MVEQTEIALFEIEQELNASGKAATILPLIAVVTINSWAGFAAELLVIALVWLVGQPFFGGGLPYDQMILTIGMGAFSGLLGWTASHQLLDVAIKPVISGPEKVRMVGFAPVAKMVIGRVVPGSLNRP